MSWWEVTSFPESWDGGGDQSGAVGMGLELGKMWKCCQTVEVKNALEEIRIGEQLRSTRAKDQVKEEKKKCSGSSHGFWFSPLE